MTRAAKSATSQMLSKPSKAATQSALSTEHAVAATSGYTEGYQASARHNRKRKAPALDNEFVIADHIVIESDSD